MPGFIGLPEIMLLGLVALIIFGPKRLPEMGRGLGKGLREFKESVSGDSKPDAIATAFSNSPVTETTPAVPVAHVEPIAPVTAVPTVHEAERVA